MYDDPTTVPSADIADNPYWKRDMRRSYPKQSFVRQPDVVGLLSVGSAANPKEDVLQIGDAGNKQLVEVKEEGERGLSAFFEKDKNAFKGVLAPNGMPPLPTSRHPTHKPVRSERGASVRRRVSITIPIVSCHCTMLTIGSYPVSGVCLENPMHM